MRDTLDANICYDCVNCLFLKATNTEMEDQYHIYLLFFDTNMPTRKSVDFSKFVLNSAFLMPFDCLQNAETAFWDSLSVWDHIRCPRKIWQCKYTESVWILRSNYIWPRTVITLVTVFISLKWNLLLSVPVKIPNHIRKQTEEELKKILDNDDDRVLPSISVAEAQRLKTIPLEIPRKESSPFHCLR